MFLGHFIIFELTISVDSPLSCFRGKNIHDFALYEEIVAGRVFSAAGEQDECRAD